MRKRSAESSQWLLRGAVASALSTLACKAIVWRTCRALGVVMLDRGFAGARDFLFALEWCHWRCPMEPDEGALGRRRSPFAPDGVGGQ